MIKEVTHVSRPSPPPPPFFPTGAHDTPKTLRAPLSQAYHDLGGPLFHGKDGLGGDTWVEVAS